MFAKINMGAIFVTIKTEQIISLTEANQTVDKDEKANIGDENNLNDSNNTELTEDEMIYLVAKRVLKRHIKAFKELAK